MKTILFLVQVLLIPALLFSQNWQKSEKVIPPEFSGISNVLTNVNCENISDYLCKGLKYPEESLKKCCEGTEVIRFQVSKNGNLDNFEVINSVSPEIDNAVIRLLKGTSGMWEPGTYNGNPVVMQKELAISFKWGQFENMAQNRDFAKLAKNWLDAGNKQLLVKNNPKKALKNFDRGVQYIPYDDCLLLSRGLSKYQLGDISGALDDWQRMKNGGYDAGINSLVTEFRVLDGFNALAEILNEQAF